jgi:hypothetical protein
LPARAGDARAAVTRAVCLGALVAGATRRDAEHRLVDAIVVSCELSCGLVMREARLG